MIGGRFKRPPHRRVTDSHESRRAEPKASTAPSVGLPQRSSERAFHLEPGVRVSDPRTELDRLGHADWIRSADLPRERDPDADPRVTGESEASAVGRDQPSRGALYAPQKKLCASSSAADPKSRSVIAESHAADAFFLEKKRDLFSRDRTGNTIT